MLLGVVGALCAAGSSPEYALAAALPLTHSTVLAWLWRGRHSYSSVSLSGTGQARYTTILSFCQYLIESIVSVLHPFFHTALQHAVAFCNAKVGLGYFEFGLATL